MREMRLVVALLFTSPLFAAQIYWYNGDSDNVTQLINESGGSSGTGFVYDDFIVGADGVNITSVFSNDLVLAIPGSGSDTNAPGVVTQADWQILSGVSAGNGGIVVASGSGTTATQTATGLNSGGYAVYDIQATGLNVTLGPGTYWLAVAPDLNSSYNSYVVTTYGFNGVGTPQAQDGNSFWNDPGFGDDFVAAVSATGVDSKDGTNNVDFSMGVDGVAGTIPEPGTAALGAGAMLLLLAAAARRFRN
jgi:hypothetical protein